MKIETFIEENYSAIVKRGLINSNTTKDDFMEKLYEEFLEVMGATDEEHRSHEIVDVISVCFNWLEHFNTTDEVIKLLKFNIENNIKRAK